MTERYVKADNNQGWPIAIGVVILALALVAWAWNMNRTTYHSPNDVMAPAKSTAGGH